MLLSTNPQNSHQVLLLLLVHTYVRTCVRTTTTTTTTTTSSTTTITTTTTTTTATTTTTKTYRKHKRTIKEKNKYCRIIQNFSKNVRKMIDFGCIFGSQIDENSIKIRV